MTKFYTPTDEEKRADAVAIRYIMPKQLRCSLCGKRKHCIETETWAMCECEKPTPHGDEKLDGLTLQDVRDSLVDETYNVIGIETIEAIVLNVYLKAKESKRAGT